MVIIGIDPGTRVAGFGVIEEISGQWVHRESGVVNLPESESLAIRLALLQKRLGDLWSRWPGAETAVEKVFLGKNADSAFKLGHARGVCLMMAAGQGSSVFEYATRQVKKSVTGSGAATKEHVAMVVCQLLKVKLTGPLDASDALALALCHGQAREIARRLGQLKEQQL